MASPKPDQPASTDESDEELVARCRTELPYRTLAFERLARRHEPSIFAVCRRYLGNQHEAEEAAQDVLLKVFHGLRRFEGRSSFRTWLYRIAVNVCHTRGERLQRERESAEALARAHVERGEGESTEPAPGASLLEASDGPIGAAMRSLAEEDRRILVLRHLAELSFEELAGVLELKLSAAKMRLYRAEERFREAFQTLGGRA